MCHKYMRDILYNKRLRFLNVPTTKNTRVSQKSRAEEITITGNKSRGRMYRTFEFCSRPFLEVEVVQPIQSKPRCLTQTCHETLKHRFDHRTLSPPPLIYISFSTALQRIVFLFFPTRSVHRTSTDSFHFFLLSNHPRESLVFLPLPPTDCKQITRQFPIFECSQIVSLSFFSRTIQRIVSLSFFSRTIQRIHVKVYFFIPLSDGWLAGTRLALSKIWTCSYQNLLCFLFYFNYIINVLLCFLFYFNYIINILFSVFFVFLA